MYANINYGFCVPHPGYNNVLTYNVQPLVQPVMHYNYSYNTAPLAPPQAPPTVPFISLNQESIKMQRKMQLQSMGLYPFEKPSQFLKRLESIGENSVSKKFIKDLWLSKMPNDVQQMLSAKYDLPISQMAKMADYASTKEDTNNGPPEEPPNDSNSSSSSSSSNINDLDNDEDDLDESDSDLDEDDLDESDSDLDEDDFNEDYKEAESNLCWYHFHYGYTAHKCIPPCAWYM